MHIACCQIRGKQPGRDLGEDASAVTGARIRSHSAAMGEIDQTGQGASDDIVGSATVDVDDQPDPAGIVLERRVVERSTCSGAPEGVTAMERPLERLRRSRNLRAPA